MISRLKIVPLAVVVVLAAASCGSEGDARDADGAVVIPPALAAPDGGAVADLTIVGDALDTTGPALEACTASLERIEFPWLPELLAGAAGGVVVAGEDMAQWSASVELAPSESIVDRFFDLALADVGGEALGGQEPPAVVFVPETVVERLQAAELGGLDVALFLHDKGHAILSAVADADGDVVFVAGDCAGNGAQLDRFLASDYAEPGASAFDELTRVAFDEEANQAFQRVLADRPEPLTWSELDPAVRLLDPDEAPSSVLDQLETFRIPVEIPDSWFGLDLVLCSRVPSLGWNECVGITSESGGRLDLVGYASDSENIELWFGDTSARTDQMYAFGGSITMAGATDADTVIQLSADAPTRSAIESTSDASQWIEITTGG